MQNRYTDLGTCLEYINMSPTYLALTSAALNFLSMIYIYINSRTPLLFLLMTIFIPIFFQMRELSQKDVAQDPKQQTANCRGGPENPAAWLQPCSNTPYHTILPL